MMTLDEALACLTPPYKVDDNADFMLKAGKMREAVEAICAEFRRREMQRIGDVLRSKFSDGA